MSAEAMQWECADVPRDEGELARLLATRLKLHNLRGLLDALHALAPSVQLAGRPVCVPDNVLPLLTALGAAGELWCHEGGSGTSSVSPGVLLRTEPHVAPELAARLATVVSCVEEAYALRVDDTIGRTLTVAGRHRIRGGLRLGRLLQTPGRCLVGRRGSACGRGERSREACRAGVLSASRCVRLGPCEHRPHGVGTPCVPVCLFVLYVWL